MFVPLKNSTINLLLSKPLNINHWSVRFWDQLGIWVIETPKKARQSITPLRRPTGAFKGRTAPRQRLKETLAKIHELTAECLPNHRIRQIWLQRTFNYSPNSEKWSQENGLDWLKRWSPKRKSILWLKMTRFTGKASKCWNDCIAFVRNYFD